LPDTRGGSARGTTHFSPGKGPDYEYSEIIRVPGPIRELVRVAFLRSRRDTGYVDVTKFTALCVHDTFGFFRVFDSESSGVG